MRAQLPPAIDLDVFYDRSESIRESVNDVKFTLLLSVVLVILVIFVFLRNVSATIIPSLALPLSIVGTFAVMSLFGYTVDNLSLMALTLAVGFVVDDAIVVLENIVRHMEMGKSRFEAALEGGREIAFTILSMTLSLAAVFIPVLFMGGIVGRLFHEFAVVIMMAILISGFVSLSLTPMLCSRFLKPPSEHHNALYRATERVFDALARRSTAGRCAAWCGTASSRLLATFGTLVATVYLYGLVPKGFIPSQDTGFIPGQTEFPQDASYDAMVASEQKAFEFVAANPNVEHFTMFVSAHLQLRPHRRQAEAAFGTKSDARAGDRATSPQAGDHPGSAAVFDQSAAGAHRRRKTAAACINSRCRRRICTTLYRASADFENRMREIPGLRTSTAICRWPVPQLTLDIDRDRASALGVTAAQVENALYSAFGARQVSTIFTPNNDYQVIMELLPEYQQDANRDAPDLSAVQHRKAGSARCRDHAAQHRRSAADHALRAVALGDHLLQHRAGRVARRCRRPGQRAVARRPAGHDPHDLPGHGRGLPELRSRAWDCCWSWRSW